RWSTGGEREIASDVQAVPATGSPSVDQRDHHLRHETDQPLHLENVQPPGTRLVDGVGGFAARVLVTAAAADPLIAARAERPAAVLRARPVAGEQDDADVGGGPSVVEGAVELVDGVRPERVAHFR